MDRAHAGRQARPGVHDRPRPAGRAGREDDHRVAVAVVGGGHRPAPRRQARARSRAAGGRPSRPGRAGQVGQREAAPGGPAARPTRRPPGRPHRPAPASARPGRAGPGARRARRSGPARRRADPRRYAASSTAERPWPRAYGQTEGVARHQAAVVQCGRVAVRRAGQVAAGGCAVPPVTRRAVGRRRRRASRSTWTASARIRGQRAAATVQIPARGADAARTRAAGGSSSPPPSPGCARSPSVVRRTRLRKVRSVGDGRRGIPPQARYSAAVMAMLLPACIRYGARYPAVAVRRAQPPERRGDRHQRAERGPPERPVLVAAGGDPAADQPGAARRARRGRPPPSRAAAGSRRRCGRAAWRRARSRTGSRCPPRSRRPSPARRSRARQRRAAPRTRAPRRAVPSVELLSTTSSVKSRSVCAASASRVARSGPPRCTPARSPTGPVMTSPTPWSSR